MITLILLIAGASVAGAAAASGGPDAVMEVIKAWEAAVEKAVTDDAREEQALAAIKESGTKMQALRAKQSEGLKKNVRGG